MTKQTIHYISNHPTIEFAARELSRYLTEVTASPWPVARSAAYDVATGGIWVGLPAEVPLDVPEAADLLLDDAIGARLEGGEGILAGANPRSVLLCVYRVLFENGCRWIRPGLSGEIIQARSAGEVTCSFSERPSYRHRGICIEGAVSYEHVRDLIDWLPKVGMNGYFFQFRESFIFFDRWYSHRDNPLRESEGLTVDQAREIKERLVGEIERRDLIYHAVGHGWTCEPFGVPGLGWDVFEGEVPEKALRAFAEVKGKRELWDGIPLNTSLCYSTEWVRRRMVDDIAGYLEAQPAVDVLHLWLADGSNNQCECAECARHRPSDLYVTLLNELDRELTTRGNNTRIAFLVYVDLYWPPERERIENPKRFILMFAPITRTYSRRFAADAELPPMGEYRRNELEFPVSVEENLSYLHGWQQQFSGDSFDYDYHLIWDHYADPGYMAVSRGLAGDISALSGVGLGGFMSCQVQRSFFPTGLPMYLLGRTLWKGDLDVEEAIEDYFASAFGPDWTSVRDYLERLTVLFDPVYLRGEKPDGDEAAAVKLSEVSNVLDAFAGEIESHSTRTAPGAQVRSWSLLEHHGRICRAFAAYLHARASGDSNKAKTEFDRLAATVWELEPELHEVFDGWMFLTTVHRRHSE